MSHDMGYLILKKKIIEEKTVFNLNNRSARPQSRTIPSIVRSKKYVLPNYRFNFVILPNLPFRLRASQYKIIYRLALGLIKRASLAVKIY